MAASLILIPVPIAADAWHTLPAEVMSTTLHLQHYFAENPRTCRRTLRGMHPALPLESIAIETIEKDGSWNVAQLTSWLQQGHSVGIMSESGMPGIADPGSELVRWAHNKKIPVRVLTGPSSLMLALAGSGLNGQKFAFHGYLPIRAQERTKAIQQLEQESLKQQQTQLFIETPYRNAMLLQELLSLLRPTTLLGLAHHLTAPQEFLRTLPISQWRKHPPQLEKNPTLFLFQAE